MDQGKEQILKELGGISQEIYDSLVDDLFIQAKEFYVGIEQAFIRGDTQEAAQIVHSLKGAALNLRIGSLADAALDLENAVRTKAGKDELENKLSVLKKVCFQGADDLKGG